MKVRICPTCGERWWCVKCGFCHRCHPDLEPPAGITLLPRGGSPTLPSQAALPRYRIPLNLSAATCLNFEV